MPVRSVIHAGFALSALSALLLGGANAAYAQNAFYTVGTYTIDAAHSVSNAYVGEDSSFSPTDSLGNPYNPTVSVVTGGSVSTDLRAYNNSQTIVSGGSVSGVDVYNSSRISVSGGSAAFGIHAYDGSQVSVSGGSVGGITAYGSNQVTISGGTVNGLGVNLHQTSQIAVFGGIISGGLNAYDSSQVTISGGAVNGGFNTRNNSQLTISGGSLGATPFTYNSQVNIFGGSLNFGLFVMDNSHVTISGGTFGKFFGSNVNFLDDTGGGFTFIGSNLQAVSIGADAQYGGTDFVLSGTLQDGTNISGYVLQAGSRTAFTLQSVPEPGSAALLAGMGAAGAVCVRKRRRF